MGQRASDQILLLNPESLVVREREKERGKKRRDGRKKRFCLKLKNILFEKQHVAYCMT